MKKQTYLEELIPADVRPPSAPEVEASIIGSILIDSQSIVKVEFIVPDMFYRKEHQLIYSAMQKLAENGVGIDTVTVYEELKKRDQIDEVGGAVYISKLSQNISSSANIENHAKIIYEKYLQRKLIETAHKIARSAYDNEDAFDIIEEAERVIFDLTQFNFKKYSHIKDVTKKFLDMLDSSVESSIKTGFYDLDNILKMNNGDLIVLAGRPSMGKTAAGLDILQHNCIDAPAGLFSLEMNEFAIAGRYISKESGLSFYEVTNKFKPAETMRGAHKVLNYNLLIDDSSSTSITELRSKARRMKIEHGIKLIVVDYLQLMTAKSESREREIAMISRGLKAVAKDLNVPVIAVAQLNRSAEARTDKKPNLSDLRESGAIEQDADSVVFVYRPEYYRMNKMDDGTDSEGKAVFIIAKQRNGATGEVTLGFKKETATFYNLQNNVAYPQDIF